MMPDGRADIEQESVTFTQVSRKHAGTYKCTASNGYGKEAVKEVVVDVNYGPEIEITEMFIHSQTGQDKVELICNVHAHPAPSVNTSVLYSAEGYTNVSSLPYKCGQT